MRIRIPSKKKMRIRTDPDPQPCFLFVGKRNNFLPLADFSRLLAGTKIWAAAGSEDSRVPGGRPKEVWWLPRWWWCRAFVPVQARGNVLHFLYGGWGTVRVEINFTTGVKEVRRNIFDDFLASQKKISDFFLRSRESGSYWENRLYKRPELAQWKDDTNEKLKWQQIVKNGHCFKQTTGGKPKWKMNGQHARLRQTTMVPGRDRYPSTWRTGLIAPSNK